MSWKLWLPQLFPCPIFCSDQLRYPELDQDGSFGGSIQFGGEDILSIVFQRLRSIFPIFARAPCNIRSKILFFDLACKFERVCRPFQALLRKNIRCFRTKFEIRLVILVTIQIVLTHVLPKFEQLWWTNTFHAKKLNSTSPWILSSTI